MDAYEGTLLFKVFNFRILRQITLKMGKGDKKTRRGKIHKGTFGVRRPRIKKKPTTQEKININKKAKV